ncbi:MAG: hypothetical protein JW801_04130 [Bacteroidales bacterium]|nr:hypothetical protein [Bacteroidales bacterium]
MRQLIFSLCFFVILGSCNKDDIKERYIINKKQMFQVRDEVYKVFDIGMVVSSIDNIKLLKAYCRNDFLLKGGCPIVLNLFYPHDEKDNRIILFPGNMFGHNF